VLSSSKGLAARLHTYQVVIYGSRSSLTALEVSAGSRGCRVIQAVGSRIVEIVGGELEGTRIARSQGINAIEICHHSGGVGCEEAEDGRGREGSG
jgi:hypothetical protein